MWMIWQTRTRQITGVVVSTGSDRPEAVLQRVTCQIELLFWYLKPKTSSLYRRQQSVHHGQRNRQCGRTFTPYSKLEIKPSIFIEENVTLWVRPNINSFRGTSCMFSISDFIHHKALYKINSKNEATTCHFEWICFVLSCGIAHYN